jgi:hypothetical protein
MLLESCAKKPPILEHFSQDFGGSDQDRWSRFAGARADRLEAIRERHLCELSAADWDAADPDAAACKLYMELSASQPTVADAIEAVIPPTITLRCREYEVGVCGRPVRAA